MLRIHDMSNSLLASTTVLHSDPLSHGNICSDLTDYPFVLNVFLFPSVLSSIQVGLHGAFASYVLLLARPAFSYDQLSLTLPVGMILQV